jgi:uncharacterized protein (TIGR03790 family)
MVSWMLFCWYRYLAILFYFCASVLCRGGGSGLNVLVVVNQNSTNSVELGNYYCEKRQVPPQNLLRINWPGGNGNWTYSDFTNYLLNPFFGLMASQQLTNQIDYVVLSMDIPFEVTETGTSSGVNSTTAALFYGFKSDLPAPVDYTSQGAAGCNLPFGSTNSYVLSETILRQNNPSTATTNSFLAVMITANSLPQAKAIVDQGVASDYTLPTQTVILGHSRTEPVRDVRYFPLESMTLTTSATIPDTYDGAIFNTQLRGNYSMIQTNMDSPLTFSNALGYENGHYQFTITPHAFVPGAMADSLTSFGGFIFGNNDQTTLLALINAGACGAYGTVIEPCNYLEKFPSPQNYFFQSRGFSLAECYYQSVTNPYQGLIVGEPLAAPFAQPGTISWTGLPAMSLLSGTTNLSLHAAGANTTRPIQQVDLFVDGLFSQTVTNINPGTNNILYVTVNGFPTNFTVPAGATIRSVTSNLTVRLGGAAYMAATKAHPHTHGDRIELQSTDSTKLGTQVSVNVSNSVGTGSTLAAFINTSRSTFLDSPARSARTYTITNAPQVDDFLQLVAVKTNGQLVSVAITNSATTTNIGPFAKAFFNAINTNASLSGADGLVADDAIAHEDFADPTFGPFAVDDHSVDFNVHARSAGWPASQIQVRILGSGTFGFITPSPGNAAGTNHLDYNVSDLYPRDHLYVTAGFTNLSATFALNTTTLPDGYHELAAVAYEGSHVHTQTRATQTIRIQNNAWSATLNTLLGGSNTAVDAILQFSVAATTNNISKIELFSTGGSLTNISGQSNATFSIVGTNLGIGLHPFYAIVTDTNNKKYRTDTKWIRLIGADTPFSVSITFPPKLTWSATAGRSYDILSQTNITNTFQLRATVTPSNSLGQWSETDLSSRQRFYRVRTSQ